jgi:hypothetical protein
MSKKSGEKHKAIKPSKQTPKAGTVGFCLDTVLGISRNGGDPAKNGHYVYIRKVDGDKCDVNTITSLERGTNRFIHGKLVHVRKGHTYSIPYTDANFKEWSGVTRGTIKGVKTADIVNVGTKTIHEKHKSFIDRWFK